MTRAAALLFLFAAVLTATPQMGQVAAQETRRLPETREQVYLSYAPLVEKTAPSVVNIFAQKLIKPRGAPPAFGDTALWRLFSDALLFGFGARERIENSLGSGVIVRADGIIVTNHHVISDAEGVLVGLADGRVFPAEILVSDRRTDIAVLRIETYGEPLPALEFADSDALKVGDLLLAIGNPFGVGQTVTSGIVSAVARTGVGISDFRFFIQTDAAINPGNSGGAAVDMTGKLVGINTAIFTRSGGSQGIGFAVPANMVQTVAAAAIEDKPLVRPWMGVTGGPVPPQMAAFFGLQGAAGVFVTGVYEGGPAEQAGLQYGDVIFSLDDKPIGDFQALRYRIATHLVGDIVELGVFRGYHHLAVEVPLVAPPKEPPANETWLPGIHILSGARVASLSPALAEDMNLDSALHGVVVLEVRRGSAAARYGLQRGDILRGFNGEALRTVDDLRAFTPPAFEGWFMIVNRGGQDFAIEGG